MDARAIEQGVPLPGVPEACAARRAACVLEARDLAKSFGGIKAVTAMRRSSSAIARCTR